MEQLHFLFAFFCELLVLFFGSGCFSFDSLFEFSLEGSRVEFSRRRQAIVDFLLFHIAFRESGRLAHLVSFPFEVFLAQHVRFVASRGDQLAAEEFLLNSIRVVFRKLLWLFPFLRLRFGFFGGEKLA